MKVYKLPVRAVQKYSNPRIILYGSVAIILFICFLLFLWAESLVAPTRWLWLIAGTLLWSYSIYWVTRLALTQRKIWHSYELQLNSDLIAYKWRHLKSPIQIRRDEIRKIQKIEGGGIRVFGEHKDMIVSISPGLDEFEEISTRLQEWMKFESITQFSLYARLVIVGSLLSAGLMYFNTRPPMLVTNLPIAFLLTSLSVISIIVFRFIVDKRLKLLSLLFALPLVVAYINIFMSS